ncbi:patatin-like phospholipase family protein [Natroniella acetigena]|uniref:patatin-like phospholipase family protein n=1 Tax=Natroniella acetigena TaxID=52004 RepID=UPI00200B8A4F|nr:patatin-like phospholipase family protein [Natroniella acetigena]MCK8828576.1 patatin-like phospholipase family protein [Natroniella acetigena]
MEVNLSLNGGGIKGISHVGGLKALEEEGIEIKAIAGSSAGAIIAALYGAGYSCDELEGIMYRVDFNKFKDGFSLFRLIKDYGLYSGQYFWRWIEARLAAKGINKFKDLRMNVKIITSEVTYSKEQVFSKTETPEAFVAEAVRMSMGIPIFYAPYRYQSQLYVDGGVMNNLPLNVFSEAEEPVLGFLLIEQEQKEQTEINNFVDYLTTLMNMVISVNEQRQIELSDSYIISILTGKTKATDFSLSLEEKKELYNLGYQRVKDNLDKFNDRRLGETKIFNKGEVRPTTVEIEEYSRRMTKYLKENFELERIDGIVSIIDDDYLFSYLLAKQLNKKFTVFKPEEVALDDCRYNQLQPGERVIITTFLAKEDEQLVKLATQLRQLRIEVEEIITFIGSESTLQATKSDDKLGITKCQTLNFD